MQFLFLFLVLVTVFFFLARWFIGASANQIKRFLLFVGILSLILLSIALFRFGGLFVAALAIIIPVIRRVLAAYTTYRYFRHTKNSGKQQQHAKNQYNSDNISEKEAQEILGVDENATKEEVKSAYHKLMQKNHPDQGGSEYFAKKLNKAYEILKNK